MPALCKSCLPRFRFRHPTSSSYSSRPSDVYSFSLRSRPAKSPLRPRRPRIDKPKKDIDFDVDTMMIQDPRFVAPLVLPPVLYPYNMHLYTHSQTHIHHLNRAPASGPTVRLPKAVYEEYVKTRAAREKEKERSRRVKTARSYARAYGHGHDGFPYSSLAQSYAIPLPYVYPYPEPYQSAYLHPYASAYPCPMFSNTVSRRYTSEERPSKPGIPPSGVAYDEGYKRDYDWDDDDSDYVNVPHPSRSRRARTQAVLPPGYAYLQTASIRGAWKTGKAKKLDKGTGKTLRFRNLVRVHPYEYGFANEGVVGEGTGASTMRKSGLKQYFNKLAGLLRPTPHPPISIRLHPLLVAGSMSSHSSSSHGISQSPLAFDLRSWPFYSNSSPSAPGSSSRSTGFNPHGHDLNQWATHPPTPFLLLHHPKLPWYLPIRASSPSSSSEGEWQGYGGGYGAGSSAPPPPPPCVTVLDVVRGLHRELHRRVSEAEFEAYTSPSPSPSSDHLTRRRPPYQLATTAPSPHPIHTSSSPPAPDSWASSLATERQHLIQRAFQDRVWDDIKEAKGGLRRVDWLGRECRFVGISPRPLSIREEETLGGGTGRGGSGGGVVWEIRTETLRMVLD